MKFSHKQVIFFFSILLFSFCNSNTHISASSPFKDVPATHWAYPQINWAYQNDLLNGYPDGTFRPTNPITEAQLVSILTNFDASQSIYTFKSQAGESITSRYYRYFKSKNMPLNGFVNTTIQNKPITRGQFAIIIAAANGLDLTEPYAVQYLYAQKLSNGTTGKKTYVDFKPKQTLSRAEATVFLNRIASKGPFTLKGLSSSPTGKDNDVSTIPSEESNFGTIVFQPPVSDILESDSPTSELDPRLADDDIEKTNLIANGKDNTYITLILKDCFGNPINYDNSYSFTATSIFGTNITGDRSSQSNFFNTDGPNLTVNVTAPKSTSVLVDTISLNIVDSSNSKMACYSKPINVKLTYSPQAELQFTSVIENYSDNEANEKPVQIAATTTTRYTTLRAAIIKPGGENITDYNGKVRFQIGSTIREASFYNGIASISIYDEFNGSQVATAQIIESDSRYVSHVAPILNKTHTTELYYEQPLSLSCPREDTEIAFIIDSSGSMQRNDPKRFRVAKTKEFIKLYNASYNIATKFNSKGTIIGTGSAPDVSSSVYQVGQSGGTNIGDGLEKAFSKFTQNSNKKIAILLTDGKSNETKIRAALQEAENNNVTIYTIGLGDAKQLNETLLQEIANETGGKYYHISESNQLNSAYQTILDEVNCQTSYPSCFINGGAFISPLIEIRNNQVYMNTFINKSCGNITSVLVRFHSLHGDVDYELINRGQQYYALKKGVYEIEDLSLFTEATFIMLNNGYTTSSSTVEIQHK